MRTGQVQCWLLVKAVTILRVTFSQSQRICGKFLEVPSAEKEATRSEQRPLSSCSDNAKERNLELQTFDTTVLLTPEQRDLDS